MAVGSSGCGSFWRQMFLETAPQEARAVRAAAEAHGIGYATLRRAFRKAGGEAVREGQGVPARWIWRLGKEASGVGE